MATTQAENVSATSPLEKVMSYKPGILEGGALYLVAIMLAGLVLGAWFLRFPDVVVLKTSIYADTVNGGDMNYAKLIFPQKALRSVKTGMSVKLQIDGYPVDEFGYLRGRVYAVSPELTQNGLTAIVGIPKGEKFSKDTSIGCRAGLKAVALVSFGEQRLLIKWYDFVKNSIHMPGR